MPLELCTGLVTGRAAAWAVPGTPEGRVGVMLGQESRTLPRQFPTPFGDVRLVTVKALLPAELEYVSKRGAEGAAELARRFAENGEEHVSRANRRALV